MSADLHTRLRAAIQAKLDLAKAATPGPWFYNSYGAVFASPLAQAYDPWIDPLIDAGHTLERRGLCEPCGDWKQPPYVPSPGYGHGCRHFDEEYGRDPLVASVPSHHGDTATGRHRADAEFMEAHDPAAMIRLHEAALRVLERHIHKPPNAYCGGDIYVGQPCSEMRDLAAAYDVEVDTEGAERG